MPWNTKKYARINWKNRPSTATALGATNLNHMDVFLNEVDNELIQMEASKLNVATANGMLKSLEIDTTTWIITATELGGKTYTWDLNLEKIPVSFSLSENGVLTMTTADGTEFTANIADLIKEYVFDDSDTIDFARTFKSDAYHVTAIVKEGSINQKHLDPDYRADIQSYMNTAQEAANDSLQYSKDSKRWAVGDAEYEGSNTDSSKYYKEQAEAAKVAAEKARDEAEAALDIKIMAPGVNGIGKPDNITVKADADGTFHVESAPKWQTPRIINGMSIDGTANRANYGVCSTAADVPDKTVTCAGYSLVAGASITVRFQSGNTAKGITLNVNGTGAKPIRYATRVWDGDRLDIGSTHEFRYDGVNYILIGTIKRNCVVGQIGTADKSRPWYKIASVTHTAGNSDTIKFRVSAGLTSEHGYEKYCGILLAHTRANSSSSDGKLDLSQLELAWELAGTEIKPENFVITYDQVDAPPYTIEIWAKIEKSYFSYIFDVLTETSLRSRKENIWTLYNQVSNGGEASLPEGYGYKESVIATIQNDSSKTVYYGAYNSFPEAGSKNTVYIDDTVDPRLMYTWDSETSTYILTGGAGGADGSSIDIQLALPSSGWTGSAAPYSQTVTVPQMREGMTPLYFFSGTGDAALYAYSLITGYNAGYAQITFYAADFPEVDIALTLKGVPAQQLEYADNTVVVVVPAEGWVLNEDLDNRYEQTIPVEGIAAEAQGGGWDIVRSGAVLSLEESKICASITDVIPLDGAIKIVCLEPPAQQYMLKLSGTYTQATEGTTLLAGMQGWFSRMENLEVQNTAVVSAGNASLLSPLTGHLALSYSRNMLNIAGYINGNINSIKGVNMENVEIFDNPYVQQTQLGNFLIPLFTIPGDVVKIGENHRCIIDDIFVMDRTSGSPVIGNITLAAYYDGVITRFGVNTKNETMNREYIIVLSQHYPLNS